MAAAGGGASAHGDGADGGPRDVDTSGAPSEFDYDYFVIGGGSGGISSAKAALEAAGEENALRVALADFVTPTATRGTKWQVGGTCVNVGCIPKKLFHTAALVGDTLRNDAFRYGWRTEEGTPSENAAVAELAQNDFATVASPRYVCDWNRVIHAINNHVRSINFGYKAQFNQKGIKFFNKYAKLVDRWTVELTNAKGEVERKTARRFLVATGGRPIIDTRGCEGAQEHGITSDDLFWLKEDPGKTLVIGASYVALECAGFLTGIGREAVVMVRSILLRGFDQQMAEMIGDEMQRHGTRFIRPATPKKLERRAGPTGPITVTFEQTVTDAATGATSVQTLTEDFQTVLWAIGRAPETTAIGLDALGVQKHAKGKIIVDQWDRTSVSNIYACGDIVEGGLELTPVAIQAGGLLARRLFDKAGNFRTTMNYRLVPTAVFTPLEYGACGVSEEEATAAKDKGGLGLATDDVEVYHSNFTPLETTVPFEMSNDERLAENRCYIKLVCDKRDDLRVIGFHVLGPNAGEITQGVGVAMRCGARYQDFIDTVGIHPTCAEEMTTLTVSKSSGKSAAKTSC